MMNQGIAEKFVKYKNTLLYYGCYAAFIFIIGVYVHQIIISSNNLFSTDFYKFYQSVRFYFDGQNIYSNIIRPLKPIEALSLHHTLPRLILPSDLNPPFFIMLLTPFAWLSYGHALLCWSVITFCCSVLGILLSLKSYPEAWQNPNIRWYALAGLLIYFPVYANFFLGQLGSILLLITAAAWLQCRKKSYDIAGILLGFAFSLKLFYGLFLIFFLIRRKWRTLFIMITTYVSCSFAAFVFFGLSNYKHYLYTLNHIRWFAGSWNASLYGFLIRLFGTGHEGNHPIINYPSLGQPFYHIISIIILVYFVYQIHKSYQNEMRVADYNPRDELDWQFSLTLVVMLLLSPLAWLYYFTLLIIPFITIIRLIHKLRHFNFNFCLLIVILLLSGTPNYYRLPTEMVKLSMAITWANYYFYSLVLLFFLLFKIRVQMNKKEVIDRDNNRTKFSPNMQLLLYLLSIYPSLIIFTCATLAIVG